MAWQGYIDESADDQRIVFAGYIASAENWAAFSLEWEKLLPLTYLQKNQKREFKYQEMSQNAERRTDMRAFAEVINRYVQAGVAVSMRFCDFEEAVEQVFGTAEATAANNRHTFQSNPYIFLICDLLITFSMSKAMGFLHESIHSPDRVSFYFDERSEKAKILAAYDVMEKQPGFCWVLSPTPRFGDSQEFMPLQAADLFSGWFRDAKGMSKRVDFRRNNNIKILTWEANVDHIVYYMRMMNSFRTL